MYVCGVSVARPGGSGGAASQLPASPPPLPRGRKAADDTTGRRPARMRPAAAFLGDGDGRRAGREPDASGTRVRAGERGGEHRRRAGGRDRGGLFGRGGAPGGCLAEGAALLVVRGGEVAPLGR